MHTRFIIAILATAGSLIAGNAWSSDGEDRASFVKCETPRILAARANGTAKIAMRPERDVSVVSSPGHFRVHYDTLGYHAPDLTDGDGNGIPDYIDSTLVYLEYAWNHEINTLGFIPPIPDGGAGGGDELDVYIKEYGGGGYGGTYPVEMDDGAVSTYITIDNNFSEKQYASHGYDALKVATAHEFFHSIQYAYKANINLTWWMEQSAVWMEEQVWDEINDYIPYLEFFFYDVKRNKTPLDSNSGNFMYGASIWPMYLSKRFGRDVIRDIWERLSEVEHPGIETFDDVLPSGLARAFNEFGVWNYFTDDRANIVDFHPESDRFDIKVPVDWRANFSPDTREFTSDHLTTRYVEIRFVGGWGKTDGLQLTVLPDGGGNFTSSLVWYTDPYHYRIDAVEPGKTVYPMKRSWEKAVLVTSCTSTTGESYSFTYNAELLTSVTAEEMEPVSFRVRDPYPNPFNPSTAIGFTLANPGHVTVRVFNAGGQAVDVLADETFSAGEKLILWKPDGLAGGVYFVHIAAPDGTTVRKATYVK